MKDDELKQLAIAGVEAEIKRLNALLVRLGGGKLDNHRHGRREGTPAERRAVSRRMKAYWAARRKSN